MQNMKECFRMYLIRILSVQNVIFFSNKTQNFPKIFAPKYILYYALAGWLLINLTLNLETAFHTNKEQVLQSNINATNGVSYDKIVNHDNNFFCRLGIFPLYHLITTNSFCLFFWYFCKKQKRMCNIYNAFFFSVLNVASIYLFGVKC